MTDFRKGKIDNKLYNLLKLVNILGVVNLMTTKIEKQDTSRREKESFSHH